MGTDFPGINTDNADAVNAGVAFKAFRFRVHPLKIRARPCSFPVPAPLTQTVLDQSTELQSRPGRYYVRPSPEKW